MMRIVGVEMMRRGHGIHAGDRRAGRRDSRDRRDVVRMVIGLLLGLK